MNNIKKIIIQNKSIISYLFFGACTTVINWLSYYLCYTILNVSNIVSTIIAWLFAVAFAFVTNKIWVFNSKSCDFKTLISEALTFLLARLATGVLDIAIMWVVVDLRNWNPDIWKLLSNILVIITNYILSKLIVFRNDCHAKSRRTK